MQLTDDTAADRNRLHALESVKDSPVLLRRDLKRKIANNERLTERIRGAAIGLIRGDSYLKACFGALTTIKSMGQVSAVPILSELVTLPKTLFSRTSVCHAGPGSKAL